MYRQVSEVWKMDNEFDLREEPGRTVLSNDLAVLFDLLVRARHLPHLDLEPDSPNVLSQEAACA